MQISTIKDDFIPLLVQLYDCLLLSAAKKVRRGSAQKHETAIRSTSVREHTCSKRTVKPNLYTAFYIYSHQAALSLAYSLPGGKNKR
jgi:hypothetical protein